MSFGLFSPLLPPPPVPPHSLQAVARTCNRKLREVRAAKAAREALLARELARRATTADTGKDASAMWGLVTVVFALASLAVLGCRVAFGRRELKKHV